MRKSPMTTSSPTSTDPVETLGEPPQALDGGFLLDPRQQIGAVFVMGQGQTLLRADKGPKALEVAVAIHLHHLPQKGVEGCGLDLQVLVVHPSRVRMSRTA